MRANIRHSRGAWTVEEDNALLELINKNCRRSGRMSWDMVRLLPGRTLAAMQSRWKILHPTCMYDGKKWKWKDETIELQRLEKRRKSIREEVEDFLETYPDADNTTVANFVNCDVSKAQDVQRLVADTIRAFGGIDVLHSNAGVQRYGTVVDMSEEVWDWIIGVNLKGAFLTCKYTIPEMRKRSGGAIVISSSVQGLASQRSVAAYAASKAGLISLTRTVALDHASENIRCNSIAPGTIHTPLLEWGANLAAPDDPEGIIVEWGKLHPIGRIGRPEEVANLVLFLASDEASFCTAGTYLVDGGLLSLLN